MWLAISKGQGKPHGITYSPWQFFSEQRIMNTRDSWKKEKKKKKKSKMSVTSSVLPSVKQKHFIIF